MRSGCERGERESGNAAAIEDCGADRDAAVQGGPPRSQGIVSRLMDDPQQERAFLSTIGFTGTTSLRVTVAEWMVAVQANGAR